MRSCRENICSRLTSLPQAHNWGAIAMSFAELLGLLLLGAVAWFWLDSLKASEAAMAGAQRVCKAEDLQFLDGSVTIESVWLMRDESGSPRLRRVYGFEYSDNGDNRRKGSVTLSGHEVIALYIRPYLH